MDPTIPAQEDRCTEPRRTLSPETVSLAEKLCEAREQFSTKITDAREEFLAKFDQLSTKVTETREVLSGESAGLSSRITALDKRLDGLDAARERSRWQLKYGATVASAFLAMGGYLGIHYGYRDLYQDVKDTVEKRVHEEIRAGVISEDRAFYNDLVAGNALNATQQHDAATVRLMMCFKEGHYYDSAVLLPLLDSIYKNDDWDNAGTVLEVLEKSDPQYEHIRDHTILAYIGSIEVQAAADRPTWLEKGFSVLKTAQTLTPPGDSTTLILIHTNYWVYYLQRYDLPAANDEISAIKQLDATVFSWPTVRRWKFFRRYFADGQNQDLEPKIKVMWERLRHRQSELAGEAP